MGVFSNIYDTVELGHFNWPFLNSHPVHPATVHFPITFLTTAYTLDTAYGLANRLRFLTPFLSDISRIAYLSHWAGLITSLPAITSGSAELYELYKARGINRTDKQLTNPKTHSDVVDRSINIGLVHGALNAVAFGVSTYAVVSRRGVKAWAPGRTSVILSALTLPGVALSAALGGELVYKDGVGVQRMGGGLDEKREGIKENVERAR
ncbi:uncharacterized protein N0V89_012347 [Didymosphaeria variabile]|uniref:DUF2231 domain-containing protein n=1 Tax=Didymosphaeria variabile TaxID=1932322 RepID=A0A9W8X928_9PLEO|nr:uncharacterized protein N0V89_012347 [Didymosphaeria variabile]KAJ4344603.1 hypothetical protein N0V89_012347 [Didymosphaeria variabile]